MNCLCDTSKSTPRCTEPPEDRGQSSLYRLHWGGDDITRERKWAESPETTGSAFFPLCLSFDKANYELTTSWPTTVYIWLGGTSVILDGHTHISSQKCARSLYSTLIPCGPCDHINHSNHMSSHSWHHWLIMWFMWLVTVMIWYEANHSGPVSCDSCDQSQLSQ